MATIRKNRTRSTGGMGRRKRTQVIPRRPEISLSEPGRLRTAHILAICGFMRSTLYNHMKKGGFPEPDGNDGRNFWNTQTIREYLNNAPCIH